MIFIKPVDKTTGAIIKVIGLGGGGGNAINTMIEDGLNHVELMVANTDMQALIKNKTLNKIQLGKKLTNGLGAGGIPKVGRDAALEDYELIKNLISGADMLFITAGMGGGTGTGAAPVVAEIAKKLNILTVGVVTKPFSFELDKKRKIAEEGIKELKKNVDTLIVVSNEKIFSNLNDNIQIEESFKYVDKILLQGIKGITSIIHEAGYMNIDFADIRTVMKDKGYALMGLGSARGENKALKAVKEAINSPLLDDVSINGATGLIINITSSPNLSHKEFSAAINEVSKLIDKNAEVKSGFVIDENLSDEVRATIIATGFKSNDNINVREDKFKSRNLFEEDIELNTNVAEDDFEYPSFMLRQAKR